MTWIPGGESPQKRSVETLQRIAFLLERSLAESYRVQAFRKAASALDALDGDKFEELAKTQRLESVPGVGAKTKQIVIDVLKGEVPGYLHKLQNEPETPWPPPAPEAALQLRNAIRGDCHTHSTWSDGGSPIIEMARTARAIGHEYIVVTDHSPRLTVANGLTAQRLIAQIVELESVNDELANDANAPPFRVLTGIEVDINEDGTLDQDEGLLSRLDMVVASVHSKLRMERDQMTARMIRAATNPHTDVLGHCTGRKVLGRGRPQSTFDAEAVFKACRAGNTSVEINCRPERVDPPDDLLQLAVGLGCTFAINTDAHAPGQLDWMILGAIRAAEAGITPDRIINTSPVP